MFEAQKHYFVFDWRLNFHFFSNGHISNVVSTLPNVVKIYVENDSAASTLSNVVQNNVEISVTTSHQPKNNIETTLKCLLKDIFAKFISNFNHCIDEDGFPYKLKYADVITEHKKKADKCVKGNYLPVSIPTNIQNYTKNYCIINSVVTLITSFPQINLVFEKGTVLSNALVMIEKFKMSL